MDQQKFDRRIDAIAAATAYNGIKEVVTAVLLAHGFERWMYASDNPHSILGFPTTLGSGYGMWLLTYMAKGYHRNDPIVAYCRTSAEPLLWDPNVGWDNSGDEVRAFMRAVAAHGFGSAVAIPLRVPGGPQGVLSVTSDAPLCETRSHFEVAMPRLVKLGEAMHHAMIRLMKENARIKNIIEIKQ